MSFFIPDRSKLPVQLMAILFLHVKTYKKYWRSVLNILDKTKICNSHKHSRLGDFKTTIDCHERQLNILKELGDRLGEGSAYGSRGHEHSSLGYFETAIKYHELHLKIAIEFGNILEEEKAYCNLGIAHQTLGDLKTAIDYYERYLKIAKDLGDRSGEGGAYERI